MGKIIGIRREDKNLWEKRTPLVPLAVKDLKEKCLIQTIVQPSKIRVFTEDEYENNGGIISEDLTKCSVIFAVKEIPLQFFEKGKTYVFFSHTIKGQHYNMPMLKKMMELGCNLIDYEKIADDKGKRLIFFGNFAGHAGMIDSLWALGNRLTYEGIPNSFAQLKQTLRYESLINAKEDIAKVAKQIREKGLDKRIVPFVCGFAGYGNVSHGAQEVFDILPFEEISPKDLLKIYDKLAIDKKSSNLLYKVVFKEEDIVKPKTAGNSFDLQDYYNNPDRYISRFEEYVPYLSMLINCIYWDEKYPRLITKKFLNGLFSNKTKPSLRVIGDISCDIEGSIEATVKATDLNNPVFVYIPSSGEINFGVEGDGVVILAVDNLPCELPNEASTYFSSALMPFLPQIVDADFSSHFEDLELPSPIKKALILHEGRLTPQYKYMEGFLK